MSDESEVVVNILDGHDGMPRLANKSLAKYVVEAAINSLDGKDLENFHDCPVCGKKTSNRVCHYRPSWDMVTILFHILRITQKDPQSRGYVLMVEHPEHQDLDDRIISTDVGIKQNHKMRQLGLLRAVGHDGGALKPSSPRMRGAYMITRKGMMLLQGKTVSPWEVHIKNNRVIMMSLDEKTSGNIRDVKKMSYEDYLSMAHLS